MKILFRISLAILIIIGITIALESFNSDVNVMAEVQSNGQLISMPVEVINYTIYSVNGSPWASINGTYPMQITPSLVGQQLIMLYPMPSGVSNISIEMNGEQESYGNLTKLFPEMVHYTYLGNWQIIDFTIKPTTPDFVLRIHYQHPIMQENGSYVFLYNLNINQYISNSSSESTAQFNINFPSNCYNFNVYLVAGQGATINNTKIPVNFEIVKGNGEQTVAFNITSTYSEQPHDELITFNEKSNTDSSLFTLIILLFVTALMIVFMSIYIMARHRKIVS